MDIWIAISPDNAEKMVSVLKEFGFRACNEITWSIITLRINLRLHPKIFIDRFVFLQTLNVPKLGPDLFLKKKQVVRMGMPPIRIEVLTDISGVNFDECYDKRITDIIDDIRVSIISSEYLKMNKKASGRTKDMNDLEHLP